MPNSILKSVFFFYSGQDPLNTVINVSVHMSKDLAHIMMPDPKVGKVTVCNAVTIQFTITALLVA